MGAVPGRAFDACGLLADCEHRSRDAAPRTICNQGVVLPVSASIPAVGECRCLRADEVPSPRPQRKPAKGADNAELLKKLDALMKELFQLHDLNRDGVLSEVELVKLNEKIAMLHYGKGTDRNAVKAKYSEVFRTQLDADGKPVPFEAFRKYMIEVLDKNDRDKYAQELMMEQFVEEARSGRLCFQCPSFASVSDPHVQQLSQKTLNPI